MSAEASPALLRPAQVQRLLGVGRSTVHDWTVTGRLIARKTLGGHHRYPADQPVIRDALAANATRPSWRKVAL